MKVLVCIPTLSCRKPYLRNCMRGYKERTEGADVVFAIVEDAPSAGEGWNRCADLGLFERNDIDFVHFTNDDVVPADGWLGPLAEAASWGMIPAARLEPAGVHMGEFDREHPPMAPRAPLTSPNGFFYSDLPENQPKYDLDPVDHGALPFCSYEQLMDIGPFIPIHFGTDKWFYHRARELGCHIVARQRSIIYNYAAPQGRSNGQWTEQDYLDYDLTMAYPMYLSGELEPRALPPLRNTSEGLRRVRDWRARTFT